MIKPLLTRLGRVGAFLCFGIFYSIVGSAQTIDDTAPCGCQADETYFEQTLTINSPSIGNWIITDSQNFFQSVAPETPFPLTFLITEDPAGSDMFPFTGYYLSGLSYSITLTNGVDVIEYSNTNPCEYPNIEGDSYVCDDSGPQSYSIPNADLGVIWSIFPPPLSSTPTGNTLLVDWGPNVGTFTITATGVSLDGCPFTTNLDITVATASDANQINCNNLVNISLNGTCELEILPDMILEGIDENNDAYQIILQDIETGDILTENMVTQDYVGRLIRVSVVEDCSGNSCWGNLFVEDKSAPLLECPPEVILTCEDTSDPNISGLPTIPAGATVTDNGDGTYLIEDFDFCGDATLRYEDDLSDTHICDGPFGSIIERTWIITDEAGNTSSCVQIINVERAVLDEFITFPPNFDDVIPGANPSLEACGNWPTLENGYPHPDFTGYPEGIFCGNVIVTYVDTPLEKCPGGEAYKLIREWTIRDICELTDTTHNQFIVVDDSQPPMFITLPNDITVEAATHTCISDIKVPEPLFVDECSEWSYTVGYKLFDDSGDPFSDVLTDGIRYDFIQQCYIIENIEAAGDMVWIIYELTDWCGNTSTDNIEVTIVDNEPPVPVCDQFTFVGLDEFGEGHAGVLTFDDGSWDNCSVHALEVIRMDGNPCGGPLGWGEKVYFCCEDVGQEVMVRLRVWDTSGNNNECMVSVFVQDNIPPELISCPPTRTIQCDADLSDLSAYGTPEFFDVCGFTLTELPPEIDEEECGSGSTVIRRFVATDDAGNSTMCTQVLTLQITDPFGLNDIDWPNDIEWPGCNGLDVLPENLPVASGFPRYTNVACSDVSENYHDSVFKNTEGYCYKILREWTVHDHCTNGFWSRVQVIKITNSNAPQIIGGCDDITISDPDPTDCLANVSISISATDDCTPDDELLYFYIIDNDPNLAGTSNSINGSYSLGSHTIRWTVTDECGNSTNCVTTFNIEDNKPPTPICRDAIVTTINEDGGTVEIWATDFLKQGVDNCTDEEDLYYSFSTNITDRVLEFSCEDIESGNVDTIELMLYITDESGNQDFCTTMLILQDNNNVCGEELDDEEEENRIAIQGSVHTENDIELEEVQIMLMSNNPDHPIYHMTDAAGSYAFQDLDMYTNYTLEASNEDSYLNGVSTLDILLIQKHILGLQSLGSPYKMIAADINNSESISAVDIVELRKLILGIYDELPSNDSWRFVNESYSFPNPNQPFPFEEEIGYFNLDQNMMESDFIAVKVGDVNFSVNLNGNLSTENRSRNQLVFNLAIAEEGLIAVKSTQDISLEGFQFSLSSSGFNLESIVSNRLEVQKANYKIVNNQAINISWNTQTPEKIAEGDVLFYLVVDQNTDALQDLTINQEKMQAEVYTKDKDSDIEIFNLELHWENKELDQFELFQNVPNPFMESTKVSFTLPTATEVILSITDVTGKKVYVNKNTFEKGLNSIDINIDEIQTSGLLYLKLETETHTATNKMLMIK